MLPLQRDLRWSLLAGGLPRQGEQAVAGCQLRSADRGPGSARCCMAVLAAPAAVHPLMLWHPSWAASQPSFYSRFVFSWGCLWPLRPAVLGAVPGPLCACRAVLLASWRLPPVLPARFWALIPCFCLDVQVPACPEVPACPTQAWQEACRPMLRQRPPGTPPPRCTRCACRACRLSGIPRRPVSPLSGSAQETHYAACLPWLPSRLLCIVAYPMNPPAWLGC